MKNRIYRADDGDLGIGNNGNSHDVIVVSVNKRSNKCKVKTITSLEYSVVDKNDSSKNIWIFNKNKLDDGRDGKITVIPKNEI